MQGRVIAVAQDAGHHFSKQIIGEIAILAGFGVRGDAHGGATVKHRSRVAVDPAQPNLRQVHLIHSELFAELAHKGFCVKPGDLGENITTQGIGLLGLPRGAVLQIGATAKLEVTGLRNPCAQIDQFQQGLLRAVLGKTPGGEVVRKSGIMAIAIASGSVRAGDKIIVRLPEPPFLPLERV